MPLKVLTSEWLTKLSLLHTTLMQVYFGSDIELRAPVPILCLLLFAFY